MEKRELDNVLGAYLRMCYAFIDADNWNAEGELQTVFDWLCNVRDDLETDDDKQAFEDIDELWVVLSDDNVKKHPSFKMGIPADARTLETSEWFKKRYKRLAERIDGDSINLDFLAYLTDSVIDDITGDNKDLS